jgi:hypothetical protein
MTGDSLNAIKINPKLTRNKPAWSTQAVFHVRENVDMRYDYWLYRLWTRITVIYSVLNWATGYMREVKYSDFVAGFMENMDLVLHLAQRPDWLRHSRSHPLRWCKGHFAGAKALGGLMPTTHLQKRSGMVERILHSTYIPMAWHVPDRTDVSHQTMLTSTLKIKVEGFSKRLVSCMWRQ